MAAPAGFPTTPVWLSKDAPTAGDAVTLYTVVYNASDTPLTGEVSFSVGTTTVATKKVSVAPGASEIVSAPWTALEGAYTFSATLSGSAVASSTTATSSVSVAKKPPPPPPPPAVIETLESAAAVTDVFASTSPIVRDTASTTIRTAEQIRATAVMALEKLASSTAAAPREKTPEENADALFDVGATIQNIWNALVAALLYVARSPLLFYIGVAVVAFVLLSFIRTLLSERRD